MVSLRATCSVHCVCALSKVQRGATLLPIVKWIRLQCCNNPLGRASPAMVLLRAACAARSAQPPSVLRKPSRPRLSSMLVALAQAIASRPPMSSTCECAHRNESLAARQHKPLSQAGSDGAGTAEIR